MKQRDPNINSNIEPLFKKARDGSIRKTLTNLKTMLLMDPDVKTLKFNEFTNEIEFQNKPVDDFTFSVIQDRLDQQYDVKFSKDDIFTMFQIISHTQSYHPIKEMIESKKWDGTGRVETLFIDYLGASNNDYVRTVTRKWLAGGVARVYSPGIKFELIPILEGSQGLGKSSLLKKLGGQFSTDSLKGLGKSKDDFQILIGSWIVEIAELASLRSTELEVMKNFTSATEDKVRLPYERVTKTFPRTCVFAGTTNSTEYLIDLTGNRRFFPIPLKDEPKYSWTELTEDTVQQIWAEAYEVWQAGETLFLNSEMEKIANEYRDHAIEKDMIAESIQDFLDMKVMHGWGELTIDDKRTYFRIWQDNSQRYSSNIEMVSSSYDPGMHSDIDGFTTVKQQIDIEKLYDIDKTTKKEIMQVVFNSDPKDRNQASLSKKVTLYMDNHDEWEKKPISLRGKTERGYKRIY